MNIQNYDRRGILVGVDGSPGSLRAVEWAARAARHRNARLTICTVYPEPGSALGYPSLLATNERRQRGEDIVGHAAATAHRMAPELSVDRVVAAGHASQEIISLAADHELVVVGSHGDRWLHRLFAGSVAAQVAAHAPCPVAVIHGSTRSEGPIVVGVDGSAEAQIAMGTAFSAAETEHTKVRAICAYQIPSLAVDYAAPINSEMVDYYRDEAQKALSDAVEPWTSKYPHIEVTTESPSGPAGPILAEASKEASLLIVGSRGLGGFKGLLLGSVSRHVVNAASCPVLIVRD